MNAIDTFREILMRNREGEHTGIYSTCSVSKAVPRASIKDKQAQLEKFQNLK
jgi:tagatose-1,6-bisphosphate aldolase non-catalytic subunit AgaZ/GatZ